MSRQEDEKRAAVLLDDLPAIVWKFRGSDLIYANRDCQAFFAASLDDLAGRGWIKYLHTDDRPLAEGASHFAGADPRKVARFRRADGVYRHLCTNCRSRDDEGALCISTDVTAFIEKHEAPAKAAVHHRVRNLLATMRAIIGRTRGDGEEVTDFRAHLDARINALARVQTFLNTSIDECIDLELLLREELLYQHARDSQIKISGPEIRLPEKAAEILSLAFHEMATNSIKYGALATELGRVEVIWQKFVADNQLHLELSWTERAEHEVGLGDTRPGFGSELIKRRIPYELGGTGKIDLKPQGARIEISFPLG